MKIGYVLFVLLAIPFHVKSQTQVIFGTVKDALTHEGLPGANILINPGNFGAATDLQGNFSIEKVPFGRYTITVSYIGFKSSVKLALEVSSSKQVFLEFLLHEEVFTSEELLVTAQPKRAEVQNLFTQVSAISFSVEETRRFAGSLDDPLRAAAVFPGVVQSGDVNSNGIVIRGSSPKGLQWRLNGVRIPNPNHFGNVGRSDGGVTLFSTQLLANSDFLTSAFPAEYGNTTSGIFDIRYRKGNEQQREHTVQAGIQGFDIATEGPIGSKGNASYLLNYRYSILGFLGYIEPEMKGKVPEYQDLNVQIDWQTRALGSFKLFAVGGTDNSSAKPESDAKFTLEERTDELLKNKVGVLALSHGITLSKSTALLTTLSYVGRDVSFRKGLRDSSFVYQPLLATSQLNYTFALDQSITQRITSNVLTQFGYRAALDGFKTDLSKKLSNSSPLQLLALETDQTQLFEAFFQTKWLIVKDLSLNAGLHSMYYALTNAVTLEPRLSLKYELSSRSSVALAYGNHAQLEDLSVYAVSLAGVSNKNVKPLRAHHFSGSYNFSITDAIHSQIDMYYMNQYQVPVVQNSSESLLNHPGGMVSSSFTNEGKGFSYGIEMMIEHFFQTNYYYLISASWNESNYKGGDAVWRNTRYSSGLTVSALGGKEWRVSDKNTWVLNTRLTRTMGEYYTPIDKQESEVAGVEVLSSQSVFKNRLPTFVYVDFSIGYKTNYKKSSGEWSIQLKNSLNQRPIIGYSFNTLTNQIEELKPLGIIPVIAYRFNF